MLTRELLRVSLRGPLVVPRYLGAGGRALMLPVARELCTHFAAARGKRRDELRAALAVASAPRDRLIVAGLAKLLLDRCTLAAPAGLDPIAARQAVFRLAAAHRRELGPTARFDRDAVLRAAAGELGVGAGEVAARLFADLRDNEVLQAVRPITAEALLARYDVALAQGVLLRATRVEIELEGEQAGRCRQLFREARFFGLLHRVRAAGEAREGSSRDGWHIELTGPLSLFGSVQRYGLALASFLPAVLRCRRWRLRADLRWGKDHRPARFELGPEDGLVPYGRSATGVAPEVGRFAEAFAALGSRFSVKPCNEIIAIAGEPAIVPDLVFDCADTGERVYLEAFGYWSRAAVWQRIETIRRGFPGRIILAAGKQLRVSEDALDPAEAGQAGELYVYRAAMQPRAVLERLERLVIGPRSR